MSFLASEGCFLPLTASMTSEFKNNYAYVITQDICNNFIEVNFCVGCMVSEPNRLQQHSTTMSLSRKIKINPKIIILIYPIGKDLPYLVQHLYKRFLVSHCYCGSCGQRSDRPGHGLRQRFLIVTSDQLQPLLFQDHTYYH